MKKPMAWVALVLALMLITFIPFLSTLIPEMLGMSTQ